MVQHKLMLRTIVVIFSMMFIASTAMAGDPIPGIDVKLGKNGRIVATETTGQNGMVTFTGLTPGEEYTITVNTDQLSSAMKAKEKANRTKCSNNLRIIGKPNNKDYATDPYVETSQRANEKGEITLQLTGECKKE
jgi:hypothetical protein